MFDRRSRLAREILVALQSRFGRELFETAIRTSVRLREAAAVGLPVQLVDPASQAAADFAALAEEVQALGSRARIEVGARAAAAALGRG
jgi:cellulose biosynthesis protein BcsQ